MKLKYTATKEIEKNIKSPKSKNSHGYDEIPMKILEVNGSVLGSFLLYINYFLNIIADVSNPVLRAVDTSIMIANHSPSQFIERY